MLKNFNFSEYRETDNLTSNQIRFIWFFLLIGLCVIIAFLIHGIGIKTPKHYRRAGAAIVIILFGLIMIFGMMFLDSFYYRDQSIGWLGMVVMMTGSLITMIGSYSYLALKFPDEEIMKRFKAAVREEIRTSREEERRWRVYEAQLKREQRAQKKALIMSNKKKRVAVADQRAASTGTTTNATEVAPLGVKVAEMEPPESIGITVIKCSKCGRSLKLTSPERPITIRCPYCEAIGVIKD